MSLVSRLPVLFLLVAIPLATSATPPSLSNTSAGILLSFLAALPPESQRLLLPSWQANASTGNSTPGPHCAFHGVTCFDSGAVAALNLSDAGLSGDLSESAPRLCALPELSVLDLSWNNFSGSVPAALAACSGVTELALAGNRLSGGIPPELLSSHQLRTLDLSFNALGGEIPAISTTATGEFVLEFLNLMNASLSGVIPPELITMLPELTHLELRMNQLSGPMPEFPVQCKLDYLSLYVNQLDGEIPHSLGNCGNLTVLFLSFNRIGGAVPDIFGSLPKLQKLYLNDNAFTGQLPASIGELADLEVLVASTNQFSGPLPESIGNCRSLITIRLNVNWLTGPIPPHIGNLSRLQWLSLKDNSINGTIPVEIGKCKELVRLELNNNSIFGTIPPEIADLKKLQQLSLFDNKLAGPVPAALWEMPDLELLQLYNNILSGQVPVTVSRMRNLRELLLACNNFTGEVPQSLGMNTTQGLVWVDLIGNKFHGAIPPGLCTGGQLQVLDLAQNQFSGSIPDEIVKCQSLWRVRLGNNLLSGSLPPELGINTGLSFLELNGNRLEGKIPKGFGSWRNLTMLDLSGNNFSGPIPPELGALRNLTGLRLSLNRLSGPIPKELGNCKRLTRLDLKSNLLSGSIPAEIIALGNLQNLILSENKLIGEIPDSFTATQSLLEVHLESNSLEGAIPNSLGNLHLSLRLLNISNNKLSKQIPSSLGNLQSLETMDLSHNSLSGPIPSQLSNMIALTSVNVSFNDLSGQLPDGWHKKSPEGFQGNPHLCIPSSNGGSCSRNLWRKHRDRNIKIIVALLVSALIIMASGLCTIRYMVKRTRRLAAKRVSVRSLDTTTEELPEDLSYDDILRATDNWSEKYVIGRGRHGTVYRTECAPGRLWAVKTVDLSQVKFPIEMKILNMVKHRNIVKMEGYCIRGDFGLILSEYMPEGTLFQLLHERRPQVPLDWSTRHQIALGAAQGLSYLHHDCVPMIVHRDFKSSNILMDAELVPKIMDFGMGKIVGDEDMDATVSAIIGTLGYIAPEHGYNTRLTEKSDIYSYGVVLLEILCRKMPVDPAFGDGVDIVAWMTSNLRDADHYSMVKFLDEEILYWPGEEQVKALELLDLAVSCTQAAFQSRPSMREVLRTSDVGRLTNGSIWGHWQFTVCL